jgi:HAD superfamily hydrolase (TIGR01509 family)
MDVPVLLLEFEGVLVDTRAARDAALAEALVADGIRVTPRLLAEASGRTTEDGVRRIRRAAGAADDETAVELGRLRAERAFAARAGKGLALQPGAREAVERLSGCARCAIVTRASRRDVEFVLGLAGLESAFRPVIAAEDVDPPKPDAAPYAAALARFSQLFPGQTLRALAVEDTLAGIRGARAAGVAAVALGPLPPHEALEADAWVESLADLTVERVRTLVGAASGRQ